MAKVVIAGHGGYGTAIKNILAMLVGQTDGMLAVDFNQSDDINTLISKIDETVALCGGDEILFTCDLLGGSPFKQCAMQCMNDSRYRAVAGLNVAAYVEMSFNLELSAEELLTMGIEATHSSIQRFPEKV